MPISIPGGASSAILSANKTALGVPTTAGAKTAEFPGRSVPIELYERVDISADSAYATLNVTLPPRCRLEWVQFKNQSAVSVDSPAGTANVADQFALCNALPATGTTTATTMIIGVSSALTADAEKNIHPANVIDNTTTSEVTLYLVPVDNGGAVDFYNHTTATSGYYFDATANVDVSIWVTQFDEPRD